MNYETAKKVLDQIKDGSIYPQWVINTALYLTGDLEFDERDGSLGMDRPLSGESLRAWEKRSAEMVD